MQGLALNQCGIGGHSTQGTCHENIRVRLCQCAQILEIMPANAILAVGRHRGYLAFHWMCL